MNKSKLPTKSEVFAVSSVYAALRAFNHDDMTTEFGRHIKKTLGKLDADPAVLRRLEDRLNSLSRRRRKILLPFGQDWVPQKRPQPAMSWSGMALDVRDTVLEAQPGLGTLSGTTPPPPANQYRIRYRGLHCRDETGRFDIGSDEIYVITSAIEIKPDGSNTIRTEKHPIDQSYYGDMDTGETRAGPIAACWQGSNLPVTLAVTAWERDKGDPDAYRDDIHALVQAGVAAALWKFGGGLASSISEYLDDAIDVITDVINWAVDTGDNQVDKVRTRILTQSKFERLGSSRPSHPYFPNGSGWEEIPVQGHFYTPHAGDNGSYIAVFDVERIPPFVIAESPVVD